MVSYEFKINRYNNISKNNINSINNNKSNFLNKLSTYNFNFQILKKKKNLNLYETYLNTNNNSIFYNNNKYKEKEKIDKKSFNRNFKYNLSFKSIGNLRKLKNLQKNNKKPESKKVKDINILDNENNIFFKEKKDKTQIKEFKVCDINIKNKERTNSFTQKRRKFDNSNNKIKKYKNILTSNNKLLNIFSILKKYKDLSSSQSHSKLLNKKFDNSFNSSIKSDKKLIGTMNSNEHRKLQKKSWHKNDFSKNHALKTLDSKKNEEISFEKDICNTSNSKQKYKQIIKRNESRNNYNKDIFYQKPIINKITIFNNISNNNINNKKKINLNKKNKKLVISKYKFHNKPDNNYNNNTMGI